jgi:hypothetical protein
MAVWNGVTILQSNIVDPLTQNLASQDNIKEYNSDFNSNIMYNDKQ